MSLPTYPNILTLAQIQAEFGGSAVTSLSEYYAGGVYVPGGALGLPFGNSTAIPSSGRISIANFSGATRSYPLQYFTPGTYYVTVPGSTNVVAAYLAGGGGGGGGGGGAGELNWGPSASGGGGGGGGAGEDISGAWNVTPGSTLTIVVGAGGAGGAGGSGAFGGTQGRSDQYDGFNGASGGNGAGTYIAGIVSVGGGNGGIYGQGAPGDDPWAVQSGGASGAGWPAGNPGTYAHISDYYYLSNRSSGPYEDVYNNLVAGEGGYGGFKSYGFAGNGGRGGNWTTRIYESYPPDRIGITGGSGGNGYLILQFGTTSQPRPSSGIGFSGAVGSPRPPIDPTNHSQPLPCCGRGN